MSQAVPPKRQPLQFVPLPSEGRESVGTVISLYSGAGGLDLGFAAAGFEPVWANDIDPVAVATYNAIFEGHAARAGDIRRQDVPGRGAADLVIGGPPCQGFSVAGKMNPTTRGAGTCGLHERRRACRASRLLPGEREGAGGEPPLEDAPPRPDRRSGRASATASALSS